MKVFADSFSKGIQPIDTKSLLLSTLTTIKAIESIKTGSSFKISFEDIV